MFIHVSVPPLIEYPRVNIDEKRHYHVGDKFFPSITTMLGSTSDKTWIEDWKKRVGEAEANRITRNSSNRGTNLHLMCEDYLNNVPLSCKMPDALEMFRDIKPILNRIDNIHHQEACLYSPRLKVAGTTDCIGEFDGVLSVIDFKNSRRIKNKEDIIDYFLQATFYALAYYELSGIQISQIVIIIAVENEKPQVFIEPIRPYIKLLVDRVKNYYEQR